mmetsp:Transcript_45645/g.73043  ORF Transcript_45645/g.73043 Transcript_45645/m.73043 type:complete len:262 (+) Transcript_45645:435-1220(+)
MHQPSSSLFLWIIPAPIKKDHIHQQDNHHHASSTHHHIIPIITNMLNDHLRRNRLLLIKRVRMRIGRHIHIEQRVQLHQRRDAMLRVIHTHLLQCIHIIAKKRSIILGFIIEVSLIFKELFCEQNLKLKPQDIPHVLLKLTQLIMQRVLLQMFDLGEIRQSIRRHVHCMQDIDTSFQRSARRFQQHIVVVEVDTIAHQLDPFVLHQMSHHISIHKLIARRVEIEGDPSIEPSLQCPMCIVFVFVLHEIFVQHSGGLRDVRP